jgi:hypothetical protein
MSGQSDGGDGVLRREAEHFRLIPRSTLLLEKLTVNNLVKFPAVYGIRSFSTMFTRGHHWILS